MKSGELYFHSFSTNGWEWNEANKHFVLKKALFSVFIPPTLHLNKFWMKMYRNFSSSRWFSTKDNASLQSCTVSYSCCQNAVILNNSERIFPPIFFNFIWFGNEGFQFCQFQPILSSSFKIWFWFFSNLNLKPIIFGIAGVYWADQSQ